jgi:hypothetical protein
MLPRRRKPQKITERQTRMLQAGVFHFDSGGDNRKNLTDASDLARRGLITMRENVYSQHSVFGCEVTNKGRKAFSHDPRKTEIAAAIRNPGQVE